MAFDDSMYGNEKDTTCNAIPGTELSEQLAHAIQNIRGQYVERAVDAPAQDDSRIPADPAVPNFSYAIQDGKIYYRRNEWMEKQTLSAPDERRMRGMIALRDTTRQLIQAQLAGDVVVVWFREVRYSSLMLLVPPIRICPSTTSVFSAVDSRSGV